MSENNIEVLRQICNKKVHKLFGDNIPEEIRKRLERELGGIYKNGYAEIYLTWSKLADLVKERNYSLGSRGSVGSSLVAYLCGITEINPLSEKDGGFNIMPEIFYGIYMDKEPEIILNFPLGLKEYICNFSEKIPMYDEIKDHIMWHESLDTLYEMQMLTGVNLYDIHLNDRRTLEFICDTDNNNDEIPGLPEYGQRFARYVIRKTAPESFDELVKICGLMHGMNTWLDNQDKLLSDGTITLRECISAKDDIFLYLLDKGIGREEAYMIMEAVRKGNGLTVRQEQMMMERGVPEWYIETCKNIGYLFCRAHVVSYVLMAWRIAWFMVHKPVEYRELFWMLR